MMNHMQHPQPLIYGAQSVTHGSLCIHDDAEPYTTPIINRQRASSTPSAQCMGVVAATLTGDLLIIVSHLGLSDGWRGYTVHP